MSKRPKLLLLFSIATVSLLLAGHVLNPVSSLEEIVLLLWLGVCGTICIYGLDMDSGNATNVKALAASFLNSSFKRFFLLQFFVLTLPLSLMYISGFRLVMLCAICFLGWLYSAGFTWNGIIYRVKDTLLAKNIFIGFGWGALVLAGAGTGDPKDILALFLFTSLQILVGSAIRDISDMKSDVVSGMRTLPVIFGVSKTLAILHVANLLTFFPGHAISQNPFIVMLMVVILGWKGLILINVKANKDSSTWTQTLNILTCLFIFILVLFQHAYELYR